MLPWRALTLEPAHAVRTPLPCLTVLLALAALPALADIPPMPGELERAASYRVREAGQDCPDPAEFQRMTAQDEAVARERGRSLQRLRCANGRSYLVSPFVRRRPGPPGPTPEAPPPPPLVLPAP